MRHPPDADEEDPVAEDAPTQRPTWLEDELESTPTRRRPLLLGLAVVPWLAVGGFLLAGPAGTDEPADDPTAATAADTAPETEGADPDAPSADAGEATTAPPVPADAGAGDGPGADDLGGGPAQELDPVPGGPSVGDVTAAALAAARASLPGPGADPAVDGLTPIDDHYLEHASLHGVELVADDLAVVTFTTVLLPVDEDAYGPPVHRRLAVPVHVTASTATPAGAPWWVPSTEVTVDGPELHDLDDPDLRLAAAEALAAAGYEDAAVTDVARSEGGALVAEVTATTPSGAAVAGPVWFHDVDGQLVPAGTPTR
ncbi:hypothetical protein FTX61_11435 [Nitriliruptoraceae bacterium ZYF776]|nr:hypothetical protein [Profundirhabdus halotolerans]